jgi:hypothetical protein
VGGTWKHVVVGSQLVQVLETLHGWTVDEHPAVLRQSDVAVDDVVYADLFGESCVWRLVLRGPIPHLFVVPA